MLFAAACASPAAPPGGPEDHVPPTIVKVTPDSGTVGSKAKEVVFTFNEVISETPTGAPDLKGMVLVSPSDGTPNVSWNRNSISVKLRHGWRDSTTYVVTLLPGIRDIEGNTRDTATVLVFSTGSEIPKTRLAGTTFDWIRNTPQPRTSIEAWPTGDTTVKYVAESDSIGRFALPYIKPGSYTIRGLVDSDRNHTVNERELWDTTTVVLRDTATADLYMYPHDSASGPIISSVNIVDSVTLRFTLDKPVINTPAYMPLVEVRDKDSVLAPVIRVVPWVALSDLIERRAIAERDSAANADTNTTRRTAREQTRRDSINRATLLADSLAKIPNRIQAAKSARQPLINEYGIVLARPLPTNATYFVWVTATGMNGIEKKTQRSVNIPKPAPKDTTTPPTPPGGRGRGGR